MSDKTLWNAKNTLLNKKKTKTKTKKKNEISSGTSSYKGEFALATLANRQFNYLEISLVYDKSDTHKTIYDSYDIELHQF